MSVETVKEFVAAHGVSGARDAVFLAQREFHPFEAGGETFLYLVPSAAVFHLDETSHSVLQSLDGGPAREEDIVAGLAPRYGESAVRLSLGELMRVQAIGLRTTAPETFPRVLPQANFPLTTMVLNVTDKCNLACTYCYEYGEDKIVDTTCDPAPAYMSEETARKSVDFMFEHSGELPVAHLTFFGGETLLNFKVLKKTAAYARERAKELGKDVDFSLTTNGTLLREEVIDWLADNRVGVTVSIDGPKETQDKFRVFKNGMGSYDYALPKIKMLLERHRTRPIGARVTLTRQTLDVPRIFHHLRNELGFWEVGFAPVTTAEGRGYAIEDTGFSHMLDQFEELAQEFLEFAIEDRHHGFSNIKDTIEEIHKGVSKAFPCGAGLGSWAWRPTAKWRSATASRARTITASVPSTTGWTASGSSSSSAATTWRTRPTATPAGPGPCAPAAATTRPMCATATRARPICTIATGFGAGPIPA